MSHWLRFQKDVQVIDEEGKSKPCRIAIAYALEENDDKKKHNSTWKIVPLDHGQVSIYFPAEKETSNLRFHIHAPFASTVARDSVRDCDANRRLRDHIANLVVESLINIRDRGMLTMSFLAVLPNPTDNLPSFYERIRETVAQAFKEKEITPTRSGCYAPATKLYRGPATIAEFISDDDLSYLINCKPPFWVANPPQKNQREDRFLDSLKINKWDWEELAETMSKPHEYTFLPQDKDDNAKHGRLIENWICQKDDSWLMRFYALLGEACDVHGKVIDISEIRAVRVGTDQGHKHVLPQEAFFLPEEEINNTLADIHFVKPAVYTAGRSDAQKKYATSLLKRIGVRPFDRKAVIELRLAYYINPPRQVEDNYFHDIEQFVTYWKKCPTEPGLFTNKKFIIGISENQLYWCTPAQICLDTPYEETGLAELSKIHNKHVVWSNYKERLTEARIADFIGFLKAIGVMHDFKIEKPKTTHNPHREQLYKDYSQSRTRLTYSSVDEDHSISNLDRYLSAKSIPASRLIWSALISADRKAAMARFRPNQQHQIRESESQLVYRLKHCSWIPDRSGDFRKPEEMTKDDLRTDFPYDDRNGLLTAINFGERAKKRSEKYRAKNEIATDMGFSSAEEAEKLAMLIKRTGITAEELCSLVSKRQDVPLPEESVPNPERRRKGVLERKNNSPPKESVDRERAIQPGARLEILEAKAYLRIKYKNADGQLICQICRTEMPFKVSGDYYFEAIQCVRGLDHHHSENRLALCPICAAMYQHARETDDTEICRSIVEYDAPDSASFTEISVRLAGREFKLRFVGTHWFDLKTVLTDSKRT